MKLKLFFLLISLMWLGARAAPAQVTLNPKPSREVGHPAAAFNPINPQPPTLNPNLVEGREFDSPEGIAIDNGVSPPIVYIADTGNSRVLGWNYTSSLGVPSSGAFPPADYVIGQADRYSTLGQNAQGNANGLAFPSGLAVDSNGNLYVVDSGNNRIARFPRGSKSPDLVIGQPSVNFNLVNQGQSAPSANTISLSGANGSIVFDKSGNLYFTDVANNRVLRYDASVLTAGNHGPSANLVLGQSSFNSNTPQAGNFDQSQNPILNGLNRPSSLAIDSQNRLYVGDNLNRVLVYPSSVFNGSPASFVAGFTAGTPTQAVKNNTVVASPNGIFLTSDNRVGVVDGAYCRILLFPSVDGSSPWPSPTSKTAPSPQATTVIPQNNTDVSSVLLSKYVNANNAEASAGTFAQPSFAVVNPANGDLFVADSGNHRVLVMSQASGYATATRVFGQDQFNYSTVNLLEGREFQFTSQVNGGIAADAGIVIDANSNPPHLYVADTYNNRILGFADARIIKPGVKADLVIGQPDMFRSVCNYNPNSTVTSPSPNAGSLCQPVGLALDAGGNLWVADRGNFRVLRFPTPFAQRATLQQADLVLGQGAQNNFIGNARSPSNFGSPYGIILDTHGSVVVSDPFFNRVVIYENQAGVFTRTKVLGQTDPNSCPGAGCAAGNALNQMRSPQHVALDSGDNIYVSDSGNNRVLIFNNTSGVVNGDSAQTYSLTGLSGPDGIFVNQQTGEIWVANAGQGTALRYPKLDDIVRGSGQPLVIQETANTIAVVQDQFGDLYVADASNRIVIHYPGLLAVNGANFLLQSGTANPNPIAPGMVAAVCPPLGPNGKACFQDNPNANYFGTQTASYLDLPNPIPQPTVLADVQVTVNGVAAPLAYVSPQQINFQVPQGTPTGATPVLLEVTHPSTGQVMGSFPVQITQYAPGLFYGTLHTQVPFSGNDPCRGPSGICYQAAALNQDGTLNSPSNPALHGTVVQLFGTGMGPVQGAPGDGQQTAGQAPAVNPPRVFINGADDSANISYAGLAPGLIGVWQINVKIPDTLQSIGTTGSTNFIVLVLTPDGRSTNDANQMNPTIAVK